MKKTYNGIEFGKSEITNKISITKWIFDTVNSQTLLNLDIAIVTKLQSAPKSFQTTCIMTNCTTFYVCVWNKVLQILPCPNKISLV